MTRWFFGQIGKAYGTILLPPVLESSEFRGEGMLAIRNTLALTRGENPALVGIAPEGHTGAEFALRRPPLGAGLFLLILRTITFQSCPPEYSKTMRTRSR